MTPRAPRVRLLAGSAGPERVPARPDPDTADWYMPLHLRDAPAARARVATQIEVGADVVVAPTWLTHRRALLPLGETRRAGDWTAAAVRLAREAVEVGLERRQGALGDVPDAPDAPEVSLDDVRRGRPAPLVAASLPALDDEAEVATGRLLPRETATERDYRDQAGIIADAEPDLILVEGQRSEADARTALASALDTGLPVWAALTPSALSTSDLEAWFEWAGATGLARLLLPSPLPAALPATEAALPWGGVADHPGSATAWLEAGARTIALLDGATVPVLESLRAALDDHERADLEVEQAARRRWQALVEQAAAMAPGGAAVWIGTVPGEGLPEGFRWHVVEEAQVPRLPDEAYRLAVATTVMGPPLERILERGGVLVGPLPHPGSLRRIVVDEAEPPLAISRREG